MKDFNEKFESYFAGCERIYDAYFERMGYTVGKQEFSYKKGRRYVKVICGGSAHSFVDMKSGEVLKPASWSAPAKGSRGNVFDKHNGLGRMTEFGPSYNR